VTREERNVSAFVAIGVLLGSLPALRTEEPGPEAPALLPEAERAVVVDLFPIDLNSAGAELLEELPGIGPAKARAILALREELGAFDSVGDLQRVRGIGPRTVERLRDLVIVGPPDIEAGETANLGRQESEIVFPAPRDAAARERGHHR
jgi:competence protein ComEA